MFNEIKVQGGGTQEFEGECLTTRRRAGWGCKSRAVHALGRSSGSTGRARGQQQQ